MRRGRFLLLLPLVVTACGGVEQVPAQSSAGNTNLRHGTLETAHGPVPITYEVRNGRAIFEDDIDLGPVSTIKPESAGVGYGAAHFNFGNTWNNGVVWYRFDHDNVTPWLKDTIERAIAHLNARTTLYLVEDVNEEHHDHILYTAGGAGEGCHSPVGRQGGEQDVVLSVADGCNDFAVAVHETGHAIGLIHEQTRLDRDNYVFINWGNIQEDQKHNFEKWSDSYAYGEYDFESVMHYPPGAFAVNKGLPTIIRRDGQPFRGQNPNGLSDADVRGVQIMYGVPYEGVAKAVSWGPGRVDLFVRGTDGALWHQAGDGRNFWGWESLGGFIIGAPEVVAWGPNRLDIFVRGGDRNVYHKAWTGTEWLPSKTGWEGLGGPIGGGLTATSWGPNRLDIFGRGDDGQAYHKAWDGSNWYPAGAAWEPQDGLLAGPMKAISWGPNRIDLFATDINMEPFHKAWTGSTWTRWESLGGRIEGPMSVASWGPGRLDVVGRGTDGALYHKAFEGAWYPAQTDWGYLGGSLVGTPTVTTWGPGRLDIFAQAADGALWQRSWLGSSWSNWTSLGGRIIGSPVALSMDKYRLDVFVRGMDDALFHKAWDGYQWQPVTAGWDNLGGVLSW